jgi:hypothetical protein
MNQKLAVLCDFPRWFWVVVLAVFIAGNISGVIVLCSVIDLMAGK